MTRSWGGGGVVTMSRGEGGVVTWSLVALLPPPPGVGQTDACENITFARFATRAVMIKKTPVSIVTGLLMNPRILLYFSCIYFLFILQVAKLLTLFPP